MARRSEHSQEQIKEMVLAAAETIVVEDGFNALTVRKIAMEIGYTVGSIYMVFANMSDLIIHLKARALDELAEHLAACPADGDPGERLMKLADIYLDFAAKHFNRWRMIFDMQSEEAPPDWYQQKIEYMFDIVESLIRQLHAGTDAESERRAARALWSGVHGISILALTGHGQPSGIDSARASVSLLVSTFIRGWRVA
ncbi:MULTISPECIES: TetR/AcrR family transcriptional regulator [Methylomonas]|uniref:TetR family transcriptional regulator n=1 Tax=Methylomonas koyamae TaxID=702114 RepID=A0A177P630_9GAMM|nr:TetR/AcrR family transcriptional regulator [Methylomonas koyamae]OAI25695.1 TetR family transcriptional regulator [Methylomonas koyamae]